MANLFTRPIALVTTLTAAFVMTLFMQGYQDVQFMPALLCLALGLVLVITRRDLNLPNSFPAICLMTLWALCALAFSFSQVPFVSQIAFCIFSALPIAFIIADGAGSRMIKPLVISAAIIFIGLSLSALYQVIWGHTEFSHRAAWPFLNPNSLASILNLGMVVAAGVSLIRTEKIEKYISLGLFFLIFAALIATGSRGGVLAGGVSLAVLFAFYRQGNSKAILTMLGGIVVIGVLVPIISGSTIWHGAASLAAHPSQSVSVTDRLALWGATWQLMLNHPLIGTGPGTFSYFYASIRAPFIDHSSGHFAHFDALQMGAEMGIAAFLLFYAFLIAVLIRTIDAVLVTRDNPALRARIIIPFAALVSLAIHAHICFPLYLMPVLIACGILLGIWHAATTDALRHGSVIFSRPLWAWGISSGLAIILICLAVPAGMASYTIQKAIQHRANPPVYLQYLADADRIGPQSFIDPELELARINLRLMEETKISPAIRSRYMTETDELLNTAMFWNPSWGAIDVLRARLLTQDGKAREALDAYQSALKKDAMNAEARRAIAEILLTGGQRDMAIKIAKDGIGYPHPLSYREWLKDFIKRAGTT